MIFNTALLLCILALAPSNLVVVEAAPFTELLASSAITSGLIAAFTLPTAKDYADKDRKRNMYYANQSFNQSMDGLTSSKDSADTMVGLAQKSSQSPLLAYQTQLVQARANTRAQSGATGATGAAGPATAATTAPVAQPQGFMAPQADTSAAPQPLMDQPISTAAAPATEQAISQPQSMPTSTGSDSSIISFFVNQQSCQNNANSPLTFKVKPFHDTLRPQIQNKITGFLLKNVKAGTEIELYAHQLPSTEKAYAKLVVYRDEPLISICDLEKTIEATDNSFFYVVKPGIAPGELNGKVNYLYIKDPTSAAAAF